MAYFCFGVLVGVVVLVAILWFVARWEWQQRVKINRRLEYLERNLCCGKGVFGCRQGPNCDWDHK